MITKEFKRNKGITLLALVITIIILLILAGITISAITGDNGIIGNASRAKEQTEIDNEKEIVDTCIVQTMGKSKYGNITKEDLQNELDNYTGEGKTEVLHEEDILYVYFTETNRYYTVDLEGEGFDTNIKKGDSVKQGDVLVVVDLDMVRQAGKSLVSPIAFTGNEKVEVYKIGQNITAGEKGLLNYE